MSREPTPLIWKVVLRPDFHRGSLDSITAWDEVGMVRGVTPRPTLEDGWLVRGKVVPTPEGLTIRSLSIEPSRTVWDNGVERFRAEDEYDLNIDSSVMKLINLTEIRNEYRRSMDVVRELAETVGEAEQIRWKRIDSMASKQRRKRAVNNAENMYRFSTDVFAELDKGRGLRERLGERWNVSTETVKSRMRLLRTEGWIVGVGANVMRGPEYIRHEQELSSRIRGEDN